MRSAALIYAVAVSLCGLYFLFLFLDIPVNTEARDYILHRGFVANFDVWSSLFRPAGNNTRAVSMVGFAWSRAVCAFNAPCLNAIQILLLLVAVVVGALHLHQLLRRPVLVAAAMLVWALSLPVFVAGFWQATQHDKLALVFSLSALILGLRTIRRGGGLSLVPVNLALAVLFVLAFNSKEAAFFLPAAAAAQVVLFAPATGIRGRFRAACVYALPMVYAVEYIVTYMLGLSGAWRGHVLSGDIGNNFRYYLTALIGNDVSFVAASVAVTVLLIISFCAVVANVRHSPPVPLQTETWGAPMAPVIVYLLAIMVVSLALIIKAQSPSEFYLLVTGWAFLGWIAATCVAARQFGWFVRYPAIAAVAALGGLFLGGLKVEFVAPGGNALLIREARRLSSGYQLVGRYCNELTSGGLKFAFVDRLNGGFYFFRGPGERPDPLLGAFICSTETPPPMSYSFDGSVSADRAEQLVVVWNRGLVVESISRGGRTLYRAPG